MNTTSSAPILTLGTAMGWAPPVMVRSTCRERFGHADPTLGRGEHGDLAVFDAVLYATLARPGRLAGRRAKVVPGLALTSTTTALPLSFAVRALAFGAAGTPDDHASVLDGNGDAVGLTASTCSDTAATAAQSALVLHRHKALTPWSKLATLLPSTCLPRTATRRSLEHV
jgi:hypothetical protein